MSRPQAKIRPFAPDDLAALQTVRRAAFAPIFDSFRTLVGPKIAAIAFVDPDAEQAEMLESVCRSGSGQQVLVATVGEAVAGFVSYSVNPDKGVGEIGLNAVHPDHAGRGIGTAMYREAMKRMRDGGARVVEVGTGGDPSHAAARRAYEKAGFGPAIPSVALFALLNPFDSGDVT